MNVGEIVTKISELKSEKAVAHQLVIYLKANYLSSDVGSPEMKIGRDDSHVVPEDHIKKFINKLSDLADEADAAREEFESFSATDPVDLEDSIRAKVKKKNTPKRKKSDAQSSSKNPDRAASSDADTE